MWARANNIRRHIRGTIIGTCGLYLESLAFRPAFPLHQNYKAIHILPQIYTTSGQPSQYRCTQLQYRSAVISEALSRKQKT